MSRWWARWRVALLIAWRDAGRHKGRTALVVAMVALPLVAGSAGILIVRSAMGTPQTEVARLLGPSGQAIVSSSECGPIEQSPDATSVWCVGEGEAPESAPIDLAGLQAVGIDHAVPLEYASATLVSPEAALTDFAVTEVDAAADLAQFVEATDGRLPTGPGEIALTPSVRQRLGAEIGDVISLENNSDSVDVVIVGLLDRSTQYHVVGLTGTTPLEWRDSQFEPRWMVLGDSPVTWDVVQAANAQGWEVWSRAVILDPPPASEVGLPDVGPDTRLQTAGLVGAVLAMGLLELGLLVGPAFAIGAKRNGRLLAVTAAAGGSPDDLRRIVLATGVVSGLVAAVIGTGVGVLLGIAGYTIINRFDGAGLPALILPTWELAAMGAVAVLLGVGAAWLPARTAGRADVVAALAGRRREGTPTKGVARFGLALAVLGLLTMLLGALTSTPIALVGGVVALEVGVVATSGTIVMLVSRLAPRLGVAGRFALRDSVRHRSRTAPAVAAVLAAVAAAAAGAVYLQGESTASRASWLNISEDPALLITYEGDDLTASSDAVAAALASIGSDVDVEAAVPVSVAALPSDDPESDLTQMSLYETSVYGAMDPALQCSDDPRDDTDPRCARGHGYPTSGLSWPGSVLVDDGTLMRAAGLPGWQEAAEVLAAGGVVVDASSIWPDGNAHLVGNAPGLAEDPADAVVLPAYGSTWFNPTYTTILSPEAAEQIGLVPVVVGGLLTTASELPQSEVDRLNAQVREVSSDLRLTADRPRPEGVPIGLVLLAVASAVALIAVGLAVGLAGADTGPDLATLAAVGAAPSVRRRVAAAQAGVISGTGAVLGVLTGIPIGLVLSLWGREQSGYGDLWPLTVPWPVPAMAVAIPLVTMGLAWLFTRSRLPLVRRVAE